jgi:hypothetical protein
MVAFRQSRRMAMFYATMSYELHATTEPDARKLLRAELVGRRWQDRYEGALMPAGTVWIRRSAEAHQTVDDVHAACARDLHAAVARVAETGRAIRLIRAWVQVSGAGTYGLIKVELPSTKEAGAASSGSTHDDKAR